MQVFLREATDVPALGSHGLSYCGISEGAPANTMNLISDSGRLRSRHGTKNEFDGIYRISRLTEAVTLSARVSGKSAYAALVILVSAWQPEVHSGSPDGQ